MLFHNLRRHGAVLLTSWQLGVCGAVLFVGDHHAGAKPLPLPSPKTIAAIMVEHSKVVASPPSNEEKRLRALAALEKALREAQRSPNGEKRALWLLNIAESQAQAGDPQAAIQTAKAIDEPKTKDQAISAVPEFQARAGDLPGALKTAGMMDWAGQKGYALVCVARGLAQSGDLQGALRFADGLPKDGDEAWSKTPPYRFIVEGLAKRGDATGAARIAEQIEDKYDKEAALCEVAGAQARAGDLPAALQTAQSIHDVDRKKSTLNAIGEALAKRGDYQAALQLLESIKDNADRKSYLLSVVSPLEAAGNVEGVQKVLAAMLPLEPAQKGLPAIALLCTHAWGGDDAGAVKVLEGFKDPKERESAWATLASVQALHGDPLKAAKSLEKVEMFDEDGMGGAMSVPDFAYGQYVTGREGTDEIIETMAAGEARVWGFRSFASQLLQDLGRFD